MADILDYHLQHYLRAVLDKAVGDERNQLKNIRLCGTGIRPDLKAVYVLASDEKAKIHGTLRCKNTFCCPVCSAIEMERHRSRIQAAIECLHKDYFGFMVSFAIPHFSFMGCREVMDILYDTFSYFRLKSFKRSHGHVYHEFNKVVPVVHHIRVCEQTHGLQGWHHHFHCIFWIPRGLETEATKWEDRLNDFWLRTARSRTLKYWTKHNCHKFILEKEGGYDNVLDRLFAPREHHRGITFSKDDKGNLREVNTADYLAGWGDDRELTGNVRKQASHTGHRTPHQILTDASNGDKASQDLYLEFCLAVTTKPVHHRVDFSQTGLRTLVNEWMKTHDNVSERLQKKRQGGEQANWKVVAYFDVEQWYELCFLESNAPVISNILFLAAKYRYLLGDYLDSLNIGRPSLRAARFIEYVESLYNTA